MKPIKPIYLIPALLIGITIGLYIAPRPKIERVQTPRHLVDSVEYYRTQFDASERLRMIERERYDSARAQIKYIPKECDTIYRALVACDSLLIRYELTLAPAIRLAAVQSTIISFQDSMYYRDAESLSACEKRANRWKNAALIGWGLFGGAVIVGVVRWKYQEDS